MSAITLQDHDPGVPPDSVRIAVTDRVRRWIREESATFGECYDRLDPVDLFPGKPTVRGPVWRGRYALEAAKLVGAAFMAEKRWTIDVTGQTVIDFLRCRGYNAIRNIA